jgi:carbon storage regulator
MPRLVLSRKLDEEILIGDDISVKVTLIDRNKVRLCVEAPAHVAVDRAEIRGRKELTALYRDEPAEGSSC